MINFILWLLFGALVGWLASIVMHTNAQQGTLLNIVVGIVGAFLGGILFNFLGGGSATINNGDFSLSALLVSFIGAVVLLGLINLVRRGSVRQHTPCRRMKTVSTQCLITSDTARNASAGYARRC